jgi:hypothetical protein
MIFCYAFFGSLTILKLHETISNFEFNIENVSYFSETTLQVLLTCVFGKTTNIDLVRLHLLFAIRSVGSATTAATTDTRASSEVGILLALFCLSRKSTIGSIRAILRIH